MHRISWHRPTAVAFAIAAAGLAFACWSAPATANAREIWTPQSSGTTDALSSVAFVDATHGWAVGEARPSGAARIISTSDGGAHWTAQDAGASGPLFSVAFADITHGWAVGLNGTILATTDGGSSWTSQTSGTTKPLFSVAFADALHGWAVGDGGTFANPDGSTILATANGGETWTPQTSPTQNTLNAVESIDASRGWAVGGGDILSTTDGGANWVVRSVGARSDLNDIDFVDATYGWAVGYSYHTLPSWGYTALVLATDDGGATWTTQTVSLPETTMLFSVTFADALHGWVVSQDGYVLATADGGGTWVTQVPGGRGPLQCVASTSADHAWAVGSNGKIIAHLPDTTAPATTLHASPASNTAGWNDATVTVTLVATDGPAGSDISTTFYVLDDLKDTYVSTLTIASEGTHTLDYWSEDASGNVEATHSATFRIDLTAPTLTLDATATYTGSATVSAIASDALSGTGTVEMELDSRALSATDHVSTSVPGAHTVFARVVDLAGNETTASATFTVLASPTSITIRTAAAATTSGKTVTLSGAVTPGGTIGSNIVVYVKKPGSARWSYSSNRTVYSLSGNAAWQYKYYFKPGMAKGVYAFKAAVPTSAGFVTSTSPQLTIRLR